MVCFFGLTRFADSDKDISRRENVENIILVRGR